jgi:BirA family biotin operon repressor/biotin-[acetyl-CoA-carboxylase] ligase
MDQGDGAEIRDKILAILKDRPGAYLPGHEISRRVGISRAALWKQMGLLRRAGHPISAKPRLGYTLVPGGIQHARTKLLGRRLLQFLRVSSTNEIAKRLAADGVIEGTVVMADEQRQGKGRMGRPWASPRGGLWFSVILRPPRAARAQAHQLAFLAGVAVALGIRRETALDARLKWPNDVIINGRKVCGVIGEMVNVGLLARPQPRPGKGNPEQRAPRSPSTLLNHAAPQAVVIGVGINSNIDYNRLPPEVRANATSLQLELGRQVSAPRLLAAIFEELERLYETWQQRGLAPAIEEWLTLDCTVGNEVCVEAVGETFFGRVAGIDPEGRLLVDVEGGRTRAVAAGDVTLRKRRQG